MVTIAQMEHTYRLTTEAHQIALLLIIGLIKGIRILIQEKQVPIVMTLITLMDPIVLTNL